MNLNRVAARKSFVTFVIVSSLFFLGLLGAKYVPLLVRTIFKMEETDIPQRVKVEGITAQSTVISWETNRATLGFIKYGETEALDYIASATSRKVKAHQVTLKNLLPQTTYYFKIGSGDRLFGVLGKPYTFKTK